MREFTSDGEPISRQAPFGAVLVIFDVRRASFLLLRRRKCSNEEWLWGPPYGSRKPFEDIGHCATRELFEETAIECSLTKIIEKKDWHLYIGLANRNQIITLSEEHDDYVWVKEYELRKYIKSSLILYQMTLAINELRRRKHDYIK
ncbi:NUDIX domain-containing protein [Listeria rocourtiae]|uniref:NUDIX domain-containing protein n=1 Tax=Listeria rocourtiae TaxID=647910 RepID=UPI001627215E|nr:NUDIX domain-containing protein [Listeria rocourtiae]MBC1604425.1 NUDIX domain-containing protein [Listeria rocourtiae]